MESNTGAQASSTNKRGGSPTPHGVTDPMPHGVTDPMPHEVTDLDLKDGIREADHAVDAIPPRLVSRSVSTRRRRCLFTPVVRGGGFLRGTTLKDLAESTHDDLSGVGKVAFTTLLLSAYQL